MFMDTHSGTSEENNDPPGVQSGEEPPVAVSPLTAMFGHTYLKPENGLPAAQAWVDENLDSDQYRMLSDEEGVTHTVWEVDNVCLRAAYEAQCFTEPQIAFEVFHEIREGVIRKSSFATEMF